MIDDIYLLELNQKGIIPGPQESETAFLERAKYCLSLQTSLRDELSKEVPFALELPASHEMLRSALAKTSDSFDMEPSWIPLFFSNYRLAPWHGGCAWIFQITDNAPLGALLQLQKTFRHNSSYLGIYHRDELIAHELAHVGRMAFNEPRFEEFLAYSTADSKFRRRFGPIVQSAKESMFFILVLLGTLAVDLSFLLTDYYNFFFTSLWIKIIPLSLILFAILRLWKRQIQYNKCILNLTPLLKNEFKPNVPPMHRSAQAVIYRLTDHEIVEFSNMTANEILNYVEEHRNSSLRWRLLVKGYFLPF